jgi:hypothetical protein
MMKKPKVIKRRFVTGIPQRQNVGAVITRQTKVFKPKGKNTPAP